MVGIPTVVEILHIDKKLNFSKNRESGVQCGILAVLELSQRGTCNRHIMYQDILQGISKREIRKHTQLSNVLKFEYF